MDRKNKGKEAFDKFSDAVRVLLVDDDKSCHLELKRMLQIPSSVKGDTHNFISMAQKWEKKLIKEVPQSDMQGYNDKDGPSSVHVLESLNSATQVPRAPAAMNISSQPHIGAPQIMTGGQAFDASTNLLANNPQNQDLEEIMRPPFDGLDFYCNFCNEDTISDISSCLTIINQRTADKRDSLEQLQL
ncbi:hypothetical protein SO802_005271 [Lithocarpus litseifolius]|uniref:Response regulatory domain-containing protein n=1 Tax=Lithocarpus litseifolius TaxID=425828 RepID=A0AAW2DKS1_9ROSI